MNYFTKLVTAVYNDWLNRPIETTFDSDHAHTLVLYSKDGFTSWNHDHSHQWHIEDGKVIIEESEGHVHYVPYAVLPQRLLGDK